MSAYCERCGKGGLWGHNVSHAKNRTNRLFKPNLHTLRAPDGSGKWRKMTICASCMRIVRREVREVQKVQEVRKVEAEALKEVQRVKKVREVQDVQEVQNVQKVRKVQPEITN